MSTVEFLEKFTRVNVGIRTTGEVITGGQILQILQSQHYHRVYKNDKVYQSSIQETLFEHLINCAEECVRNSEDIQKLNELFLNPTQINPWFFYLVGFFHDIGKPGAGVIYHKQYTMKHHNIIGGALIEQFNHPEFLTEFNITENDLGVISRIADLHTLYPCTSAYPIKNFHPDSICMRLLRMQTPGVRIGLHALKMSTILQHNKHVVEIDHMSKFARDNYLKHGQIIFIYDQNNMALLIKQTLIDMGVCQNDILIHSKIDKSDVVEACVRGQIQIFDNVGSLKTLPKATIHAMRYGVFTGNQYFSNMNPLGEYEEPYMEVFSCRNPEFINEHRTRPILSISKSNNHVKDNEMYYFISLIAECYINYHKHIPKLPDVRRDIPLHTLLQELYTAGGIKYIKRFGKVYDYFIIVNTFDNYIEIGNVKYRDSNRIWKYRWAREARGRSYIVRGDIVYEFKTSLMHGIELLTKEHIKHEITETENITPKTDFYTLDVYQSRAMQKLMSEQDQEINVIISEKVDGALCNIVFIPNTSPIYDCAYDLSKKEGRWTILTENGIFHITTSGCNYVSPQFKDYIITAMAGELNVDLVDDIEENWRNIQPKLKEYLQQFNCLEHLTLSFELICKDRTTYKGYVRTELSSRQDFSCMYYLGYHIRNKYIPYFQDNVPVRMPRYRKMTHTKEVFKFMEDLNNVSLARMSEDEFSLTWFDRKGNFHPEGVVYLTMDEDEQPVYSKLKSYTYYKTHKPQNYSFKDILNLQSCEKYYPVIGMVKQFCQSLEAPTIVFVNFLRELLQSVNVDSPQYKFHNPRGQKRIDKYIETQVDRKTIFKMFVNTLCPEFVTLIIDKFIEIYKISGEVDPDLIKGYCIQLTAYIELWSDNYIAKLKKLISEYHRTFDPIYKIFVISIMNK